jgi:predicted type IV restriction endonuclease
MDMMGDLKEKIKRISELTREEIGRSEENVKQKIVVPLLESLGHHRNQLDFEYGTGGNE